MTKAFSPKRVLRPREQVEQQIREAILSGHFTQGQKLPSEAALSDQFSVSRTTVREALRSLAGDGLIRKVPGVGGGSFVESIDHESLGTALGDSLENVLRLGSITNAEVRELRSLLEVPAAGMAAENRDEEDLEKLRDVIKREKGLTVDDPRVADLDIEFHSLISAAAGNRPLAAFVAALHRVTQPVARIYLTPEVGRATVRQHKVIVDAIDRQDSEAAKAAMVKHLDYLAEQANR